MTEPEPCDPRRAALDDIVALSAMMLVQARADAWSAVVALETERRLALEQFFDLTSAPADAEFIAMRLKQVLALDAELIALGERARRSAAEELGSTHTGKAAEQTYMRIAEI